MCNLKVISKGWESENNFLSLDILVDIEELFVEAFLYTHWILSVKLTTIAQGSVVTTPILLTSILEELKMPFRGILYMNKAVMTKSIPFTC